MKHFYTLFLFAFIIASGQAQPRQWLEGKLILTSGDLEGVNIININADFAVVSDAHGYFSILARPGDSLMVSAVHIIGKTVVLKEADFEKSLYFVTVESMVTAIDEIRVRQYKNITAESLGIVKNVKRYTPAERKLRTASQMTVGSIITLDPLINWISGRTAMLKKELAVERKERLMDYIELHFEKPYLVGRLKIPESHWRGFLFFAVEDKSLAQLAQTKDLGPVEFRLAELAAEYLDIIQNER